MKISKWISLLCLSAVVPMETMHAERCFHMPMDVVNGQVTETVSGRKYEVKTANVVEPACGVKGQALRLDGYSNYIESELNCGTMSSFTFSLWCAMETWPIIEHDKQNETEMTCIAGNYDAVNKTGFGFFVSRIGKISFKFYSQGWPGEIASAEALPLYEWNNLVAVADGNSVTFYHNGKLLGSKKAKSVVADGQFIIGKSVGNNKFGMFNTNTINGIIDEIELYDEVVDASVIRDWQTDAVPELSVVGEGKYDNDIMRPRFHGMPSRNWTNETHGLIHYNGQYHLFFQKNANGPYMSRLQWGHLVSDNLYDWKEMPIAIGSDKWYDLKGCWSGCIAIDEVVTDGVPNIIYTGVDYVRAMIGQASPIDDNLLVWEKRNDPIIEGKPDGLSDDFRDPYFFRNGEDAYVIVGTSKDGKGACTLHKYNRSDKSWSNDGKLFFSATSIAGQGSFWEMPTITSLNGKSLFTVTPLGMTGGVKAIYYTGSINADGTFKASVAPTSIELPGFAKDGYGLLSPSIMQIGDKTLAIGIVPDKLSSEYNYDMGWAHTYSLPREWSLDDDGSLVQKPYSGLEGMRVEGSEISVDCTLNGVENFCRMNERQLEVLGEFTVNDSDFGFRFFVADDKGVRLTYSPATGKLSLDMRSLNRIVNDVGVFDGFYESRLPAKVVKGSTMRIHVFVDHSIMDIFINDRWASSVRVFPKDAEADGVEVFSEGGATPVKVNAWYVNPDLASIDSVAVDDSVYDESEFVDVYNMSGVLCRRNIHRSIATDGLCRGFYIVGNKKVAVR